MRYEHRLPAKIFRGSRRRGRNAGRSEARVAAQEKNCCEHESNGFHFFAPRFPLTHSKGNVRASDEKFHPASVRLLISVEVLLVTELNC